MLENHDNELAEGVRAIVGGAFDSLAMHRFVDSQALRVDPLQATARDLGCFALTLPDGNGGLGLGLVDMVPIYAVLGRYMPPLPVFATALATDLLALAGAAPQLDRIAAGALTAVALPSDRPLPGVVATPDEVCFNGEIPFLLDGADADILLVRAEGADGPLWLACPHDTLGVERRTIALIDETRHAAHVRFQDVRLPATCIVATGELAIRLDERLLAHAALGVAADSLGGADAILDKTLDYLRVREQFSRPIGSFQALKHRAANLYLRLVAAQSLVDEAVAAQAAGSDDVTMLALLACAQAGDAYAFIAQDALQLHGGIGFTRDHDAHIHLKRAKLNQALLGGSDRLLDRAAGLSWQSR